MDSNDITLEGPTATWVMPRTDGELGGTYTGAFTFKCFLDPIKQLQAGREYRELLGNLAIQATDREADLAYALVQLKHRIIKAPPFWTSTKQETGIEGNIGDLNIIAMVLESAMLAESVFKEKILKDREVLLEKTIKRAEELAQKKAE